MLRTFKDLLAWQKAFELSRSVYALTRGFPRDERFGLSAQLRRSAVSVPSNIAEGYGRGTLRDYVHFLWTANGSLAEPKTQLLLARELRFAQDEAIEAVLESVGHVDRLLKALIRSLEAKQVSNGRTTRSAKP